MRTLRRVTLTLAGALAVTSAPAASQADFPTRTDVVVRVADGVEKDGSGVVKVLPRVQGDAALCDGTIRLTIRAAGEIVVRREKPVKDRVNFRVGSLEAGKHRVIGRYRVGDQDPCDISRDLERIRVR